MYTICGILLGKVRTHNAIIPKKHMQQNIKRPAKSSAILPHASQVSYAHMSNKNTTVQPNFNTDIYISTPQSLFKIFLRPAIKSPRTVQQMQPPTDSAWVRSIMPLEPLSK